MELEKCKSCNKIAVWFYMPGDSNYCDDCVPRGCSCNNHSTSEFIPSKEEGLEGEDWIFLNESETIWTNLDYKGREYPCVEYFYDNIYYEILKEIESLTLFESTHPTVFKFAEESIDEICNYISSKIDLFSIEELDSQYEELDNIYKRILELVKITEERKDVNLLSYTNSLKIRNKIDDCMQLIYDKVYPPFEGLTPEELQIKKDKLKNLFEN